MEQPRFRSRRAVVLITLGILGAVAASVLALRDDGAAPANTPGGGLPVVSVPEGPRIVVEVLNGSGRSGLARTATTQLRRAGIDVVYFGNGEATDSTRLLVRRGSASAGERVGRALGTGTVQSAEDTLRRVDITVVLGKDYTPPKGIRP